MAQVPKGQRQERVKTVIQAVLAWGVVRAKVVLTQQWSISPSTWRSYLDSAHAELRAAVVESAIDVKSKLVARLEDLYSKPGTSDKTKLGIIAQLAKLHGAYAPERQIIESTILDATLQSALIESD